MVQFEIGYTVFYLSSKLRSYLISFPRKIEILVENRDFCHTPFSFDASVRGEPVGVLSLRLVWRNQNGLAINPTVNKV